MAEEHDQRSADEHCGAFSLKINERTQERCQSHCQEGEECKHIRCCVARQVLAVNHDRLAQEPDSVLLEGEDAGVEQYTQHRNDPEHLVGKDCKQVTNVELFGRIDLSGLLSYCYQLLVKLRIHDTEDKVVDQTDQQKEGSECDRGKDRMIVVIGDTRNNEHGSGNTQTSNRHLNSHRQCHFFAFEPFRQNTAHGRTRHLTTTTEDGKSGEGQFASSRHAGHPGS